MNIYSNSVKQGGAKEMEVLVAVLIKRQAILDEWTLMTSHFSGNGPLSRMGDMAAWEPWSLELAKR